jgi:hypothetical protein
MGSIPALKPNINVTPLSDYLAFKMDSEPHRYLQFYRSPYYLFRNFFDI